MSRSSPPVVHAAGALVWRVVDRRLEVLLVHRPRYDDWSWPKGKRDPGECLPACAVREVREETGVDVVLGHPLPVVRYRLADGATKEVRYWAATPLDPHAPLLAARAPVVPADTKEIDDVRWVEARAARKLLTERHDRDLLGALVDQWHDEKLRTWTFVVVRHGRARKRSAWKGGELTRPLTAVGEAQSRGLVPLLSAFGVARVITSPWERCRRTVEPYAEAAGLELEIVPALTEDAHAEKPRPVRTLVERELTERAEPVAVCTHRPVLPTVMEVVAARAPYKIMAQVPESDPWLKTGEVLVVHVSRRPGRSARVVALEKHRPSHPD